MKGRVIAIVVLLALGGLVAYLVSNLSFKTVQVPVPLRGEAARNPFYAAIRFSALLGAEASWERVLTTPPTGGVIVASEWHWSLSRTRRERLQQWVEDGGRLILDDSVTAELEEFESWSGIGQRDREEPEEETEAHDDDSNLSEPPDPDDHPFSAWLSGPDCHLLTEDVSHRVLKVCDVNRAHSLVGEGELLWVLSDKDGIHAIRKAVGRGSVTVLNATPFRRRDFMLGDHPLLFATAAQLQRGDVVIFLTEGEQASILALMWRFGAPALLLLLLGVALALWRASPRFGPRAAPTESARRSLAEQIRGTGRFALRFGSGAALHKAALRALRDAAIHRFPGFDHMSAAERVAALGKLGVDEQELAPAMHFTGSRNSHELRGALTVLESARRRLLAPEKAKHGN